MKNKDLKKSKESIIGKIIYGFLLFMPLLAIFITCNYAIFNKNAYQSYEKANAIDYELVTNVNQFEVGQIYNFSSGTFDIKDNVYPFGAYSRGISFTNFELSSTNLNLPTNPYYIGLYVNNSGNLQIQLQGDTIKEITFSNNGNYLSFTFEFLSDSLTENFAYNDIFTKVVRNEESFISNVFYYSVDKVEQSNLFNWSKTTIIYTGIQNTCTQLGITNTFTPMLLAYWLLISVVYILYDIILMILIILHNRVHRLQDSMS